VCVCVCVCLCVCACVCVCVCVCACVCSCAYIVRVHVCVCRRVCECVGGDSTLPDKPIAALTREKESSELNCVRSLFLTPLFLLTFTCAHIRSLTPWYARSEFALSHSYGLFLFSLVYPFNLICSYSRLKRAWKMGTLETSGGILWSVRGTERNQSRLGRHQGALDEAREASGTLEALGGISRHHMKIRRQWEAHLRHWEASGDTGFSQKIVDGREDETPKGADRR